jgi:DNA-binding response OmpR family regulator
MERILLVEDDASLREDLQKVLVREGFHCDACKNASEARGRIGEGYALYILDVLLPDGDGIGLCAQVRRSGSAPVLFLTACDDEAHAVHGLDAGGDDYVTKPFRLKELLSRIRALLRRSRPETSACLHCGALTIHPGERRATFQGGPVSLTPTEFDLLLLLMQNPKRTLTRAQLLQRLWDEAGNFVDDNTLSVHISHLREKMEDLPLATVRGIGYMWDASVGRTAS